jgi:hypothetical protein
MPGMDIVSVFCKQITTSLLDKTSKAQATEAQVNKWNIKLKKLLHS